MSQMVQVRRLPLFLNAAVLITLVTGALLMWWASGGFSLARLSTPMGMALSIGSILTLAAALLGQFVNAPTAARLGRLASRQSDGPPSPDTVAERARLQQRLLLATQGAALLLTLAAVCMGAARYL